MRPVGAMAFYCEVKVTPFVGDIVRKMHAELGATVTSNSPLVPVLFPSFIANLPMPRRSLYPWGRCLRLTTESIVDRVPGWCNEGVCPSDLLRLWYHGIIQS